MKISFYVSPFPSQGDPFFFAGALTRKVVPQATVLRKAGHDVRLILGEMLDKQHDGNFHGLRREILPAGVCGALLRDLTGDPHAALYADPLRAATLAELLRAHVSDAPDVVVAWEAPCDALRDAFPGALILSQMPGAVSRAPHPETTTIDPAGLFRRGLLTTEADAIRCYMPTVSERDVAERFLSQQRAMIGSLTPFSRAVLDPERRYQALVLVPLQVSAHYAFGHDTGMSSQIDFLLQVLAETPRSVGVVATQYVAGRIADTPLSPAVLTDLRRVYPNLIWKPEFDRIDGVSQYLLPCVDAVCSLSSSIGLQAKMFAKPLVVPATGSHIAPYADATSVAEGLSVPASTLDGVPFTAFLLGRYQPGTAPLLHEPAFADALVTAFFDRARSEGLDRLPRLTEIQAGYGDILLGLAKPEVAAQRLGALPGREKDERAARMLAFSRIVASPDVAAVSFDVFDTLVDRPLEQPTHVFRLIEPNVEALTNGKIRNFERARVASERAVRVSTNGLEITLSEIYDELARRYDLDASERDAAFEAEIAAELKLLRPRPHGQRLYESVRATGKPILIISDMYLPQSVVEEVLTRTGYHGYDRLFLSSTHGCRKHDGGLFKVVLNEYPRLEPRSILHVGDNPDGDVKRAEAAGLRTWHIPRATVRLLQNRRHADLLEPRKRDRTLGESAVVGAIARRFFDDPHAIFKGDTLFNSDAFTLGYAGVGPALVGMAQWLREEARRDARTDLYFLARDGKVLKDVFDTLFRRESDAPQTHYIYASRRAARVASVRSRAEILEIVEGPLAAMTAGDFLQERFGVEVNEATYGRLRECGVQWSGQVLDPHEQRDVLRRIAVAFEAEILANAAAERQAYIAYLERNGLRAGGRAAAVVDVGYAATMQSAIATMLNLVDLAGYYFITFESARRTAESGLIVRGFAGDFVERRTHSHPICGHGFLFETLFCTADGSFVRFADAEGRQPILVAGPEDGARRTLIEAVHSGSRALAQDLAASFGTDVGRLRLDPYLCCRTLTEWIERPAGRDAEILEGVPFEDAFGGARTRFLVPPREIGRANPQALSKAIWQQGTAVFFRRPDIAGRPSPTNDSELVAIPSAARLSAAAPTAIVAAPVLAPTQPKPAAKLALLPRMIGRIETQILNRCSDRKQRKYLRNRAAFFGDSANPVLRLYGRLTYGAVLPGIERVKLTRPSPDGYF
jgi:FMN phosphatase YigB (HAD superfamily)